MLILFVLWLSFCTVTSFELEFASVSALTLVFVSSVLVIATVVPINKANLLLISPIYYILPSKLNYWLAIPFFIKALGSSHVPLLLKEFAIAFMTFVSLVIPKCKWKVSR